MVIIRSEQMDAFKASAMGGFEAELLEHLKSFEPALCRAAGDAAVRYAIHAGLERARGCGLSKRGSLCFFLELIVVLGFDFDTDPQLYWAGETLRDQSFSDEVERTSWLYDRMTVYLDEVAGENNQHAVAALKRLYATDLESQAAGEEITVEDIIDDMESIYPEKAEFAGRDVLRVLIRDAGKEAASYSLPAPGGTALVAGLKLALGHGICRDPLYPWVGATLTDHRIRDGEARLQRLLRKLRVYIQHVLEYLNG